jgi:hypothetical protein
LEPTAADEACPPRLASLQNHRLYAAPAKLKRDSHADDSRAGNDDVWRVHTFIVKASSEFGVSANLAGAA